MSARAGLLGPGRRRNGLGPFLARWCEAANLPVAAAAGRSLERSQADCAQLATDLGHPVQAYGDLESMLSAAGLDALIIASPVESHRRALELALAAGLHVLCEKPLVTEAESDAVPALVEGFQQAGLVFMENCPWPEVLPALDELYPDRPEALARLVEMRLSPSGSGRPMVEDSLSHFISLLQGLLPVDAETRAADIGWSSQDPDCEDLELSFQLHGNFPSVQARFIMARCAEQPRPAWLAVDGCRMDRRIQMTDYRISFVAEDREAVVSDPVGRLVYGFANLIRNQDLERIRSEAERIRDRARLYGEILASW
ncbi:MAG: Gfo/Idh/MocA family oxidoreductase [Planctomycetota bacterium]|jgi:predicted dehydrogenase